MHRLTRSLRPLVAVATAGTALAALLMAPADPAEAFGTTHYFGQRAEHEHITRSALGCPAYGDCLDHEPLDVLAGKPGDFGGVGQPDVPPADGEEAHCDNADFLSPSVDPAYPRDRGQASAKLLACVQYARAEFHRGVDEAGRIVDAAGNVARQWEGYRHVALHDFGRALHAVQDFYSHSNWGDLARPGPVGRENPPGLNQRTPTLLFNLLMPQPTAAQVPYELSTGCYDDGCEGRVVHGGYKEAEEQDRALNKDKGRIDDAGHASDPKTYRGQGNGGHNFRQAVGDAISDTRLQWKDFLYALTVKYGSSRGSRIGCYLARDNPREVCGPRTSVGGHAGGAPRATAPGAPRTAPADPSCGIHTQQPGGAGATVFVQYKNCGPATVEVAPLATEVVNPAATFAYARLCRPVAPGGITSWVIDEQYFPGPDVLFHRITHC